MNFLSTGVDPECDKPSGVYWEDDLDGADLKQVTGLAIGKATTGLSRVVGAKRIKYVTTTTWTADTAEFVRSLPCLKHLHITRVRGSIVNAGKLASLRVLSIFACPGLESLKPFVKCTGVESLWISGCIHFKQLDGLKHFQRLSEFEIQGAMTKVGAVKSLAPLSSCTTLKYVSLATRIEAKDLSPLHNLKQLKHLWLQNRFQHEQYAALLSFCPRLAKIELHDGSYDRTHGFQE